MRQPWIEPYHSSLAAITARQIKRSRRVMRRSRTQADREKILIRQRFHKLPDLAELIIKHATKP